MLNLINLTIVCDKCGSTTQGEVDLSLFFTKTNRRLLGTDWSVIEVKDNKFILCKSCNRAWNQARTVKQEECYNSFFK